MPQMAPMNWTLMYMTIIFLFFALTVQNFFLIFYKTQSYPLTTARKTNYWK
uniref:ATP synthase F0 subunit 8 n=1 Tax=Trigonopterus kotamobagensis TaxID=2583401 RepID=A0A7H1KI21_9CUCU|nr:ATP synthase F0 subunit 8 [Trigonopterus kotamobagensis]QNT26937.1 ATP synthase F0 subunit 8 [Trigonopterus kotamobagensis]